MEDKTLIILNPHAAGGRAGQAWPQLEPLLWERLGSLVVAITDQPSEVRQHLESAYQNGLRRVVSIGGDGTNHALINALAAMQQQYPAHPPVIYGMLPIGTGRDWARSVGIPFEHSAAVDWLAQAQPHPIDIGQMHYTDVNGQPQHKHFLNIASVGLGGEVDRRVNAVQHRRPWTFLRATVEALLTHPPQPVEVRLDGSDWYAGDVMLVAVANGTTFGHGMRIAPHARVDDGLFDVVLVKHTGRLGLVAALRRVYNGTHLDDPRIAFSRAAHVQINAPSAQLISLDLDGEHALGHALDFRVQPGLLSLLKRRSADSP